MSAVPVLKKEFMKYKMACPNTNAGDMEYINDSYSALFLESLMIDQFFFYI